MKSFIYTVPNLARIHARPAGMLVKEAKQFKSRLSVAKGERKADLKKLFAIMSLGIKQGDVITLEAEGPDEETAISAVETFLKANL